MGDKICNGCSCHHVYRCCIGPRGPQGAQGETGPRGPTGPAGPGTLNALMAYSSGITLEKTTGASQVPLNEVVLNKGTAIKFNDQGPAVTVLEPGTYRVQYNANVYTTGAGSITFSVWTTINPMAEAPSTATRTAHFLDYEGAQSANPSATILMTAEANETFTPYWVSDREIKVPYFVFSVEKLD